MRFVASSHELPDDPRERVETMLRTMARHVVDSLDDEKFVAAARAVALGRGRAVSPLGAARRALRHVQAVRYVWDPVGVERLQRPMATLHMHAGDCNSLAVLLAALLAAVGVETRFVAVKAAPGDDEWAHVYVEVLLGGTWVPADPSPLVVGGAVRHLPLGVAPAVEPVEAMVLDAVDPAGQLHGLFSKLKRAVGEVLESSLKLPLKLTAKATGYAWNHMGEDMRSLVSTIGPLVADYYLPGLGGKMSQAALGLLEARRQGRKAARRAKKLRAAMAEAVAQLEAQGVVEPGLLNLDDPAHLQALVLLAQMPDEERRRWRLERASAAPEGAALPAPPALARPRLRTERATPTAAILALAWVL